ncbi:hypothetical protein GWK47_038590 [Chionoecetes opilio]|uniref:Uncharacterized protein n=1 Tax=Chionoecetes opilio TaxID=41210 RepID=A0A8J4YCJ5_CHIOP|nr:hypothetical protein GWK47_038590 [Chionoecetes opilio]
MKSTLAREEKMSKKNLPEKFVSSETYMEAMTSVTALASMTGDNMTYNPEEEAMTSVTALTRMTGDNVTSNPEEEAMTSVTALGSMTGTT